MTMLALAMQRLTEATAIVSVAEEKASPMLPSLRAARCCYVKAVALLTRVPEPRLSHYDYIVLEELCVRADVLVRGAMGGCH